MASLPLITADLVRRLTRPEDEVRVRRSRMLQQMPFNPLGVAIHSFGEATVLICRGLPGDAYTNNILGLEPDSEPRLDEMLDFFGENGVQAYAETWPGWFTADMASTLTDRGLAPIAWSSLMMGLPDASVPAPPDGVELRRIGPADAEQWADVFLNSFVFAGYDGAAAREHVTTWAAVDDWLLYLATLHGHPAAVAMLTTNGGVGYLALAGTLPAARGHGCQTALIRQRLADAAAAGCDIVCCQTGFDTTSQHNLERCGFRLAATGVTWSAPEAR